MQRSWPAALISAGGSSSERDYVLPVSFQDDRGVRHRENSMIVLVRLRTGQQCDPLQRRVHLRRSYALLIQRRLRFLHLQLPLSVCKSLSLLEHFLLELGDLLRAVLIIELFDAPFFGGQRS